MGFPWTWFGKVKPLGDEQKYNPPLTDWPPIDGRYVEVVTRRESRGSARYGFLGPVLESNPIGAGQAHAAFMHPQRHAFEVVNGAIFWSPQARQSNFPMTGLFSPAQLAVLLPGDYRDAVINSVRFATPPGPSGMTYA
jgi:hypothetical protein